MNGVVQANHRARINRFNAVFSMRDLCVAARFFDLPSAMVARSYLESNGLFAVTPEYYFASVNWHMTFALPGLRVMVRQEDLSAAQALLHRPPEKGWELCPSCGSDKIYRSKSWPWAALSFLILILAHAATAFVQTTARRRCLSCDHRWTDEMKAEADPLQTPLLLVGSIPLEDAEAVFDTVAKTIGPRLASVPDGETGLWSNWIGWQHAVFATQDALQQGDVK
jgi:hypothetical protein